MRWGLTAVALLFLLVFLVLPLITVFGEGLARGVTPTIDEIRPTGAIVRIAAVMQDGTTIHVELTREQCDAQDLRKGQGVHVRPLYARVF